MRLRVLHVGKFYPPSRGGMEKVLQLLCETASASIDSRVLVAGEQPITIHETMNGVPVTRVASLARVGAVAICPSFPYWLRKVEADVTVVHEPNPVALVAHAIARPSSPVILWFHAEVVRPAWRYQVFYRPFLVRMLRRARRIVVSSPSLVEHASELQPYRHKCVVVPFAVEPCKHALTNEIAARVLALKSEAQQGRLVLFVGRLVPYKGVDVLLRAVAGVNAHLVVVGEGPSRVQLERLASALDLSDRVRFTGNASEAELTALYNACDLLVLPSVTQAEAFGMVQLEAMACGKPVISTDLPTGVPWVNQDGITGLVVPPGDVSALAAAMRSLVEDPDRRARMGAAGRRRVETEFSVAKLTETAADLYQTVRSQAARVHQPLAVGAPSDKRRNQP